MSKYDPMQYFTTTTHTTNGEYISNHSDYPYCDHDDWEDSAHRDHGM